MVPPDTYQETPLALVTQTSSASGGWVSTYTFSGFANELKRSFMKDDAAFDDGTGDGSCLGCDGFRVDGTQMSEWSGWFAHQIVPIAASSPAQVQLFDTYRASPLQVSVAPWSSSVQCTDVDGDGFGEGLRA
ncbi:MAG: hypothetical protein HC945_01290 [Nitrosarchaeum sp.]|nr:hypothetical protein [Nitrosarchaeum sp.]